jgi:excisionase family DNA binding protein
MPNLPPLTTAEAADYLGVSQRFIRRLVQERRIPFYRLGKLVRFDQRDLDAFLDNGRIEASR